MEAEPKLYRAIMVSSTFTDLKAHRSEAIDAIARFGFRPNVMEYSGARTDADVIDTSLEMVRDSAAYLCVIGHKYGQTPADPDRNPKALSITELEFNEARKLGRPILLFLMGDDHPVTKDDVEPDSKKRKKLEAFREQAKGFGSGEGVHRVYDTFESKDEFAKQAAIAIGLEAIRLAGGPDLPGRAIRDAIARFIDVKPDAGQAELIDAINRFEAGYRALEQQVASIPVNDNRVTSLKVAAEAALAEGDLDKARAAYREAAEAARDKAAEPVRTAAELKSAEAGAHLLALDWQAADAAWAEAAAMLAPFNPGAADEIAEEAGDHLGKHGKLYGRAGALSAAINRWRTLSTAAEERCDECEAARFQNNLGNMLMIQGQRTSGPEGLQLLDEAVTAYRKALTVRTRADMPAQWAMTQNNLGNVLQIQGERTDGRRGLQLLGEAVTAYRDALSVHTRDDMAMQWAMTQSNLGSALRIQGERTEGTTGVRLLGKAITAHRDALTVHTSADLPVDWAITQINLGATLQALGHCTSGAGGLQLLDEAVVAYRDALTVLTCADMPTDWAMTQNNVGNALQIQGQRTGGSEGVRLLDEAMTAYRHALTVYTRADMPTQWAMTQNNLGLSLESMAEVDPDGAPAHLLDAEAALIAALSVYTAEDTPFYHIKTTDSLARIRAKLAALDS